MNISINQQIKQKMDSDTLARAVNAWDVVGKHQKTILSMGYTNTGRSTYLELINKYQHGVKNPDLVFEKDKYLHDGVISAKTIKIQTVLPAVYKNQTAPGDDLAIVDVPCHWLPPQLKKWTSFDQKFTINMMFGQCKEVGILLFIEQKNTRTNPQLWKKTLSGFLDMFRQFPEELINSVGWVITKSPPELTEQAVGKRLQLLQGVIKNEKNLDPALIDKLFQNIITNNRIFIFKKTTGIEEQEGQQIKSAYKNFGSLCNYVSNPGNLKDYSWTIDQNALFKNYLADQDLRLYKVVLFISSSLGSCEKMEKQTPEELSALKEDSYSSEAVEMKISSAIRNLFEKKSKEVNILAFVEWYKQILQEFTKNLQEQMNIGRYTSYLARYPLFNQESDMAEFQRIQEAVNFSGLIKAEDQFRKSRKALEELLTKDKIAFIEKVIDLADSNDNELFYQNIIQLIESDKEIQSKFSSFLAQCKEDILKFRNPKKVLEKYIEVLSKGPEEKIGEVSIKIAAAIQKEKHYKSALIIYKLAQSPGDALRCMQQVSPQDEKQALEQINYYADVSLFESAKKACYYYCSQFGNKSRKEFGQKLRWVMEMEQKYLKSVSVQNLLLQQVALKQSAIDQIRMEAESVLSKLPDN